MEQRIELNSLAKYFLKPSTPGPGSFIGCSCALTKIQNLFLYSYYTRGLLPFAICVNSKLSPY